MGDSEKFSNNNPDLQDAIRSIEATGEDSGAISGEGTASNAELRGEPNISPAHSASSETPADDSPDNSPPDDTGTHLPSDSQRETDIDR
jgi:hypothetical protein